MLFHLLIPSSSPPWPPPALHHFLGYHPASRQCPPDRLLVSGHHEHMVFWPAVDQFPDAAATCPFVWCFASISLWLRPKRPVQCSLVCARGVCASASVSIHFYTLLLHGNKANRPPVKQRWTCREMGIDVAQSQMRMCFHIRFRQRWPKRHQINLIPDFPGCRGT